MLFDLLSSDVFYHACVTNRRAMLIRHINAYVKPDMLEKVVYLGKLAAQGYWLVDIWKASMEFFR